MKKFFALVMNILAMHSMSAMEQPEKLIHLEYIVRNCPNDIIKWLDGKSFSSLMSVSTLFKEICETVPFKYMSFDFPEVADHGSEKLICRFIEEICNTKKEQFICGNEERGSANTVTFVECIFEKRLQDFLGDCSIQRVSYNGDTVRYLLFWKKLYELNASKLCVMYHNVAACNDMVNFACRPPYPYIAKNLSWPYYTEEKGAYYCGWETLERSLVYHGRRDNISQIARSEQEMFKNFIILFIFIVAAEKNHAHLVYSLLNAKLVDSWSDKVLMITTEDIDTGNAIKDVVLATIHARQQASSKK